MARRPNDYEVGQRRPDCASAMWSGRGLVAVAMGMALLAGSAAVGPASASVVYRLSGTVFAADSGALPSVGDALTGYVELTEQAVAAPVGTEFSLGNGDALDIRIYFGPYDWNLSRPSVSWVHFEGYLSADKSTITPYSVKLLENFFGTISGDYCLTSEVCVIEGGGGNGNVMLYDGRGYSFATTNWTRVPEPVTPVLIGTGLLGLLTVRKRQSPSSAGS